MEHVDFLVIGSGPAGQKGAIQAAKLGHKVVLVERKAQTGGVTVHTGTIPSKTLREAALYLSGWKQRQFYGRGYRLKRSVCMADLTERLSVTITREIEVIRDKLHRNGVTMVEGSARFLDPHTIRVESADDVRDFRADKILIATGTRPHKPEDVPFDDPRVIDSDGLLNLEDLPRSLTIVGAGVIGVEYATIFSALDVRVSLVDRRTDLLGFLDREIVHTLEYLMRDHGIVLRLGDQVASVDVSGPKVVTHLKSGKQLRSDVTMFAAGRQGCTEALDLDKAGLTADARGLLQVNEKYQTDVPHVFAAGDVIGFPSLASTSMEQGRLAARAAFDAKGGEVCPQHFPYGIYAVPEISIVGATEEELVEKGVPYEVGVARLRETSRGQILGLEYGVLKLLFSTVTRRLLGAHVLGEGATELVHVGQAAIVLGGTLEYFVDNVFNYPTLAEAYKMAALDAWNRMPSRQAEAADEDLGDVPPLPHGSVASVDKAVEKPAVQSPALEAAPGDAPAENPTNQG